MVRRASDADIDAVLAFAAQIFADEQDIPKELNFIPADKQPQWWCMEQDGELVGTAAIYREGGQWHMGRITVARRLRGQHKGTFLLKRVLDDVFAQDVDNIFLEARDATVHILTGFGAEIAGGTVRILLRKRHTDDSNANRLSAAHKRMKTTAEGVPWQSIIITVSPAVRAATAAYIWRTAPRF